MDTDSEQQVEHLKERLKKDIKTATTADFSECKTSLQREIRAAVKEHLCSALKKEIRSCIQEELGNRKRKYESEEDYYRGGGGAGAGYSNDYDYYRHPYDYEKRRRGGDYEMENRGGEYRSSSRYMDYPYPYESRHSPPPAHISQRVHSPIVSNRESFPSPTASTSNFSNASIAPPKIGAGPINPSQRRPENDNSFPGRPLDRSNGRSGEPLGGSGQRQPGSVSDKNATDSRRRF